LPLGTLAPNLIVAQCGVFWAMPITLDEIVEEARQLPADVVAELVDRIVLAKHGGIEQTTEASWRTEIRRRIADIQEHKVQGIPVEESLRRIGKLVQK